MWIIDFPTLLIIIFAGILMGYRGLFGEPPGFMSPDALRIFQMAAGVAAVWQLFRQRLV